MLVVEKSSTIDVPTIVTIGNFDGVHIAHKSLINNLNIKAQTMGLKSVVLTFSNHPEHFFGNKNFRLLTTIEEKLYLFEKLKIDYVFVEHFDEKIANLEPDDFFNFLTNQLNAKSILLGDDNAFGKNKSINTTSIENWSKKHNINFFTIHSFVYQNQRVSSSLIRNLILDGNITKANEFLGHNYFILSDVIKGKGIGKQIGFPTANLSVSGSKLIPQIGVYAVVGEIDNEFYLGICNIGHCPTLKSEKNVTIETFFFDFSKNIYDKKIKLLFLDKIRDEQKFKNKIELISQIEKDQLLVINKFSEILKTFKNDKVGAK